MECHEVKVWVVAEDRWIRQIAESAYHHMAACGTCKKLYDLNDLVEMNANTAFKQFSPPPGLLARIKTEIQAIEKKRFNPMGPHVFKRFATALATAAIFIILILNPFSGHLGSLGEVGSYALANHIDSKMSMSFRRGQINDVPAWFSKRLGFPITIPDVETRKFHLLGGRECYLGKKKAAYLYYDSQGEKISLFIINHQDLGFPLAQQKTYTVYDRGHEIKIWIQGRLCYALVK